MTGITDTYNIFTSMEKDLSLDRLRFRGCNPWELLRFQIYGAYMKAQGLVAEGQHIAPLSLWRRSERTVKALGRSPMKAREAQVLIMGHQRRHLLPSGKYRDIYLHPYLNLFSNNNITFRVLERPYPNPAHFSPAEESEVFYLDNLFIRSGDKGKKREFIETLEPVIKGISNATHLNETWLRGEVKKAASHYSIAIGYFRRLLQRIKPEKILMAVSYVQTNQILTLAARELGIQVVEVQHGIISRYHMGYSFEKWQGRPLSFPDKILLFGDFWRENIRFPIAEDKLLTAGAEHLKRASMTPDAQGVLFISQGSIGEKIIEYAFELSKTAKKEIHIAVKLHPAEKARKDGIYGRLRESKSLKVYDGDVPIYQLFGKYRYAVGGYSTALLEALNAGMGVMVLPVTGIEYMEKFIELGLIKKAGSPRDILKEMETDWNSGSQTSIFAPFNGEEVLKLFR